jgi:hypothetical protein
LRSENGTFADFDLRVMDMRQHLAKVPHVNPLPAAGALHEVIGLGLGDAVRIDAAIISDFRH